MDPPKIFCLKIVPPYRPYLSLQSDYPLSTLYHVWNFLKKLHKAELHAPNLDIIDDFQTIIIGTSTMPLCSIGLIFHKLLDEIKDKRKELLMGIDLEAIVKVPVCRQLGAHSSSLGFLAWLLVLSLCFSLHPVGYLMSLHLLSITRVTLPYLYPPPISRSSQLCLGSSHHQLGQTPCIPYLSLLFLMMSSSPIPPIFSSPKDIVYIDL